MQIEHDVAAGNGARNSLGMAPDIPTPTESRHWLAAKMPPHSTSQLKRLFAPTMCFLRVCVSGLTASAVLHGAMGKAATTHGLPQLKNDDADISTQVAVRLRVALASVGRLLAFGNGDTDRQREAAP